MPSKETKFSKETVEAVKQYNLIDDILFTKAAEEKEFCQEILRTICEDPELVVLKNTSQCRLQNLKGHSVVFDALCQLKGGTLVNIEVQKANDDDHQRRVRYNGSVLAANITRKSTKFKNVPNIIIVFITSFDLFKKGYALYHIDRVVRETKEVVQNGLTEIYVNAAVKDGSKVSELMRIFVVQEAYNEELFPVVSGIKKHYKETEEGEYAMCTVTEKLFKKGEARGIARGRAEGEATGIVIGRSEGRAEGRVEGKKNGIFESIKNLMSTLEFTAEKAMEVLKIPAEEREDYKRLLNQQ